MSHRFFKQHHLHRVHHFLFEGRDWSFSELFGTEMERSTKRFRAELYKDARESLAEDALATGLNHRDPDGFHDFRLVPSESFHYKAENNTLISCPCS